MAELDLSSRPVSRSGLDVPAEAEGEEGPLWHQIKRQLYKPEVSHMRRLVGDALIQQNKLMWEEVRSLRQMLADFQEQNDQLEKGSKPQLNFRDNGHRDLLRRQAVIILEDLRSQATACGYSLEDLVPQLREERLRNFIFPTEMSCKELKRSNSCFSSPPATPSTRPPSSLGPSSHGGYGGHGGYGNPAANGGYGYGRGGMTPEPYPLTPSGSGKALPLPLGQSLGPDAMQEVAAGIREALQAEHDSLLAAINEEMQQLEAEDERRAEHSGAGKKAVGEPSTTELQQFLHRLQDVVVSPSLRALALVAENSDGDSSSAPSPIVGGASVRRLQALISQKRRDMASQQESLNTVPEVSFENIISPGAASCAGGPAAKLAFDPFFDDPFALA
eukprot:TRINITY_DN8914_c0_g4_i1.p1 TRINITY_DN8914_c0_g4~~TRINITY_DN8914_c0_g4_i1.p1  ORF type:complete len:389 (+),score=90.60 TRINITY_DN8914_c0_g4_i1:82-1248(+)